VLVLENHREQREAEHGDSPHILHARESLQAGRERIRHLVFNLLRAATHPVRIDEHLILREVRNGVHGRLEHRAHAERDEQQRSAEHEEAILQTPFDDALNNSASRIVVMSRAFT